ncbi:Tryptophan synthase alpha chain [Minicystis rosea]|nr:Tryptophan synthase alpha chain [Minicystis rosea]
MHLASRRRRAVALAFFLGAPWAVACSGGETHQASTGNMGGGGTGGAVALVCMPGETLECFSGAPEQKNVGLCVAGHQTCKADGSGFGPCEGEVLPTTETCGNPADEDCDGLANEDGPDCVCTPGDKQSCYSAAPSTKGVGPCKAGTQVCNAKGTGWGPCMGEVTPVAETCFTGIDDDCDGKVNESGAGCKCMPNAMVDCYTGPQGTANVGTCKTGKAQCNADGTALGPCMGDVIPVVEACLGDVDADCDGKTQEITACACTMGDVIACYTGPQGTEGIGVCHGGQQTCLGGDQGYGPCTGEVKPTAEVCATMADENCNGTVNEGCPCSPGQTGNCYTGPAATENVGVCHGGTRICNADGLGWGACTGQVVPATEVCANGADDDCDGVVDEKTWVETTIDIHTPGPHSSLVVDANGGVHALYHDTNFNHLIYAYKPTGGVFSTTTVDIHTPGAYPQLVVDASGGVHALYHDTNFNHLVYAYKPAGGVFATTTVDIHTPGPDPRLVVDVNGGVHALYHDTNFNHLVYAYKPAGGVFATTTVDIHTPGPHSVLVVDAAGGAHALYHDTNFNHLVYAYKPAGGVFTTTTVDVHQPAAFPKLVVDAAGGVHALYHDTFFHQLDYSYKPAGGTFTEVTVDVHQPGDDPQLVIDASGGVHALYHDTFFDDLDYAYKPAGGAFAEVTVDVHGPGDFSKLAVDASGGVHALYVDTFFNHLNHAYKPPAGVFADTTVDVHQPGDDPRFVIDAEGGLHALYFDTFFDDLDYAYRCP